MEAVLTARYSCGQATTGRPANAAMVLLKMLILSNLYGLSDRATAHACNDRLSFWHFLGLGSGDQVPEATALVRFRRVMGPEGIELLLAAFSASLTKNELSVTPGVMVDATVTLSARKARRDGGAGDPEAGMARKGAARGALAYKAHTATDGQGLVLGIVTTPGNLADCQQLGPVLGAAERCAGPIAPGQMVVADKGYAGKKYSAMLKDKGLLDGIMGKGSKHAKLDAQGRARNLRLSKVRFVVERTFGSVKYWFKAGRSRYMGLAKTHLHHLCWALCYNIRRLAGLVEAKQKGGLAGQVCL